MPVLRPSGSDFTSFVKAAAQYVPPGRSAKASKSGGGMMVAPAGLGAVAKASIVAIRASPTNTTLSIPSIIAVVAAVTNTVVTYLAVVTTYISSGFFGTNGIQFLAGGRVAVFDYNLASIYTFAYPGTTAVFLAGTPGQTYADGTGSGARFKIPLSIHALPNGNLITTEQAAIRHVTYPGAVVTTIAGSATSGTQTNGTGAAAVFGYPNSVTRLPDGNLMVCDAGGSRHSLRLITISDYAGSGTVTLFAGGNVTAASIDGTTTGASFSGPWGIATLPNGNLIVNDGPTIRYVTYPGGVVTTIAGSGTPGFADGTGAAASFNAEYAECAVLPDGTIVVPDRANQRIRLVRTSTYALNSGVVTTIAGNNTAANQDGTGTGASFFYPSRIAVNSAGNVILTTSGANNGLIRQISLTTT